MKFQADLEERSWSRQSWKHWAWMGGSGWGGAGEKRAAWTETKAGSMQGAAILWD